MARGQGYKPISEWTEKRKENHIKYDQQHYSVVGSKLPREIADAFRALCAAQGVSVSAALASYIRSALQAGTLDIIAPAPVLPADVSAVGVSEIVPAAVDASQVSPAGEKSQAGTGTGENPSISQPAPQNFPESTRPAQWDGQKSPSNCTNPSPQPDLGESTRNAPRAPARTGNKPASAFPPEKTPPRETPPEDPSKK